MIFLFFSFFNVGKDIDSKLQNLNIKVQQEQFKNSSGSFPISLEISNEGINIEFMFIGSNGNNKYSKKDSNIYILSKNIRYEIRHTHDNLIDS